MTHIDHGEWERYTPAMPPSDAPPNALFARRKSDGIDWYDYVKIGNEFARDSVKFAALWQPSGYVIGPATYDETMLFPAGHIVGEVTDYAGNDPQADFGGKIYDPVAGTISNPVFIAPALNTVSTGKTAAQILGV